MGMLHTFQVQVIRLKLFTNVHMFMSEPSVDAGENVLASVCSELFTPLDCLNFLCLLLHYVSQQRCYPPHSISSSVCTKLQ